MQRPHPDTAIRILTECKQGGARIVLPPLIRRLLHWNAGDKLAWSVTTDGRAVITRLNTPNIIIPAEEVHQ